MKIEGDTIIFKSTDINYNDEVSGKKKCTVRLIGAESSEFEEFKKHKADIKRISIVNKDTGSYFTKDLSLDPIFFKEVFEHTPDRECILTRYFVYIFCWE